MKHTARSYIEQGNLTRGQYGVKPVMVRVSFDYETSEWIEDATGHAWGAWDPDHGMMAPWPDDDVIEDTTGGER